MVPCRLPRSPDTMDASAGHQREEMLTVKKWFVVMSAGAVTAVCVALLAGKDDIRRFLRMRKM
jgi:hypothetical protein